MNWDTYFHKLCESAAEKSPCLSRKIGSLIVRENSIVSTGFNGPPRGVPHCGHERWMKDEELTKIAHMLEAKDLVNRVNNTCPRRILGYSSGTHMELCTAQHAEENAVSNAARNGVSVLGCTLYINCIIPCQKCFGTLINAGIIEIVVDRIDSYDKYTKFLMDNSKIKIREFNYV
jgi:dCMP deaminase